MDFFIKELLYLHHQNILETISSKLELDDEEKKNPFKNMTKLIINNVFLKNEVKKESLYQYQKSNRCVQIEDYISMLQCVHNH